MVKARVPIREGYFVEDENGNHLVGTKCKSCGRIYFPPLQRCPECYGKELEETELSGEGKLYTYTVIRMPVSHYKPPFALAWVELPGGVRVFTQLKNWENTELRIGMDMKLVIDTLWEEEEKVVYGYKFEPSS